MKPNAQQEQWLQNYLHAVLNYRETYEEVYDHIFAALENRPGQRFFESLVNVIITDEFGGYENLKLMEESCRDAAIKEVKKQYWSYFIAWLKLPLIIFTVIFFLLIYYIASHISFII